MSKFIVPNIEQVLTTKVDEGITLFTIQDIQKLKDEIANEKDYRELKNDTEVGYQLWVKERGEGSGIVEPNVQYDSMAAATSKFLRHKYTCELPFPVPLYYDVSRDYGRRYEWDKRDAGRKIVRIYHVPDEPNGMKYQIIEQMLKNTGSVLSIRDCVTLTTEYWEGDTCYFFSKSISPEMADKLTGPTQHVRSDVLFLGMKLEPTNDGKSMRYWCVTQLDPKGWLPPGVMNWATRFIPKAFKREVIHAADLRTSRDSSTLEYINYYKLDSYLAKNNTDATAAITNSATPDSTSNNNIVSGDTNDAIPEDTTANKEQNSVVESEHTTQQEEEEKNATTTEAVTEEINVVEETPKVVEEETTTTPVDTTEVSGEATPDQAPMLPTTEQTTVSEAS